MTLCYTQARAETQERSWFSFKETDLEVYTVHLPLAIWVLDGKHNTLPSRKIHDV